MPGLVSATATTAGEPGDGAEPHVYIPARRAAAAPVDWAQVAAELAPIACDLSPPSLRRKSRDFFWFSPVLSAKLSDVCGDLVAMPKTEDELMRLARYCLARGLPLTARGAGTGNYGQAMPLHGGVVVDLTAMGGLKWLKGGVARVGAGMNLMQIETEVRPRGWELRFHPSTWRTATVGGFIAGGSSGVGAINYGVLSEPGNVLGLRLLTLEDEPRYIELRGAEARKAIHAYGTTGLITEVELGLAPAMAWREYLVCAPGLMDVVRLADRVACADGVIKKELAPIDWGAARYFDDLEPVLRPGQAVLIAIVAEASAETFAEMVAEAGGEIVFDRACDTAEQDPPPLFEFCWNHTTLRALKHDRSITYLQVQFDPPGYVDKVAEMAAAFGDEVPVHLEFARVGGVVKCFGLPLVRFTTEQRLNEIIALHRASGVPVFDPHTYLLESGERMLADPVQFAFKKKADPYGLLNPGKMQGWGVPEGGFFTRAG